MERMSKEQIKYQIDHLNAKDASSILTQILDLMYSEHNRHDWTPETLDTIGYLLDDHGLGPDHVVLTREEG